MQKAKAAKVVHDQESALDFLTRRRFARKRAEEILATVEREEGHPARTAWDFAQGISAFARTITHTDERVQIEQEARLILDRAA